MNVKPCPNILTPNVISYDPTRLRFTEYKNCVLVHKQTHRKEYENYLIASRLTDQKNMICIDNNHYLIELPSNLSWDDNAEEISMSYIRGQNLEMMLRDEKLHSVGVRFLESILNHLIVIRLYWLDFAPRNIIISWNEKKIFLIDFERGFIEPHNSAQSYIQLIWEEYSCFLLPSENKYLNQFDYTTLHHSMIDQFILNNSNRVKSIKNFFDIHQYKYTSLFQIYSWIVHMELPYEYQQKTIFPIIKYEYLLQTFGYDYWASYVGISIINRNKKGNK